MSQIDVKNDFSRDTPAIIECCQSCRYYKEYPSISDGEDEEEEADDEEETEFAEDGICRRYPPKLFPGLTPISVYPDVSGRKGWCGEYTPGL